jgi:hypothetical protein
MADLHKLSKQVADVAERLAYVADAASGRRSRRGGAVGWVVLPLAGAMAYAVAKRSLKGAVQTKDAAAKGTTEQPDFDLLGRVKEVVGVADQLEHNRADRAKRRRRRRASVST